MDVQVERAVLVRHADVGVVVVPGRGRGSPAWPPKQGPPRWPIPRNLGYDQDPLFSRQVQAIGIEPSDSVSTRCVDTSSGCTDGIYRACSCFAGAAYLVSYHATVGTREAIESKSIDASNAAQLITAARISMRALEEAGLA